MMEGEESILKYIFCGKELLYFFLIFKFYFKCILYLLSKTLLPVNCFKHLNNNTVRKVTHFITYITGKKIERKLSVEEMYFVT